LQRAAQACVRSTRGLDRGPVVGDRTLVERHDDVRPQVLLDVDRFLRREAVLAAVDVGDEGHPIGVDPADARQTEDLEAARIGQDRVVPGHEAVQAAHVADQIVAGRR
jgi:hypothetical protein